MGSVSVEIVVALLTTVLCVITMCLGHQTQENTDKYRILEPESKQIEVADPCKAGMYSI